MKKQITLLLVVAMILSLLSPVIKAKGVKFDYESRKAELKAEREEYYNWYMDSAMNAYHKIINEIGVKPELLGPTPGATEKYVTLFRQYSNGYMMKNPAPETMPYEDEFYIGTLSIVDVAIRHIIPTKTEFFVTYGGYVHLKDMYKNMPKDELEQKMKAYYEERASIPTFEAK